MPSRKELVAYGRDEEQIAAAIGADLVIFQTLPDLVNSVKQFQPSITTFDCSVFTGDYVTGNVDEGYLQHIEDLRADNNRAKALNLTLGALEGKGGGGIHEPPTNGTVVNGSAHPYDYEAKTGASTPTNGTDDTVGLHNTWNSHS